MDGLDLQRIGKYQLLDVIGRGGMGIVYRALDTSIERQVAIKMLLGDDDQGNKELLARFYREVRSTANLQHKNIVTVYVLDDFGGLPYMVMEYLEGQSIAQIIASHQPLSIIEKIGLICQVCEGLQFAHERDVIHRDVKPANILVLKDGTAKIVDFGIARVGRNDSLTRTGQIVGSVYYMSPEQTSGVVDRRSDLYSTGVSLFEFLTGEVPFKGPDTQSTLLKIVQDPIPALSKYLPAYPKALDAILAKATAKNVDDRYQTAEDLGYDLAQLHDSLKREMTDEFLTQAKEAIEARNWDIARLKLQEVLRFDRRNQTANELYWGVREQIQLQQRSQQIEQLKSQAQVALAGLQYEEALECVEQAKRLAPDDEELDKFSRSIKSQMERARELSEALRRGQAALYAGDLSEAGQAVHRALEIDESNTEARALETLVRKEFEDRSKRAKLQVLMDEARREISSRNFFSALQSLEKAQSIDPADSNIRELLTWAASGYEQEKQRTELRRYTDEIGRMVAEDRYSEALAACETGLQKFPNDVPLTKLYELSKRQLDVLERRRAIDEVSVGARSLLDSGKTSDAIRLLESALQRFHADPNLEMLLEITRAQADGDRKEEEERVRQVRNLAFDSASPSSSSGDKDTKAVNEILIALESALSRRLALSRLEALAVQLSEASKRASLTSAQSQKIDSVLAQVSSCAKVQEEARAEMNELGRLMGEAGDIREVDSALDRARFIFGQHPKDDIVSQDFEKIRNLADEVRAQREAVRVRISDLLRSMQSSQSITEIEKNRNAIRQLSGFWAKDDLIRNLLDQVSTCVNEALERRSTVLNELMQLADSVSAAKSCGQLRFLKEQVTILRSELDDREVSSKAAEVEGAAIRRIHEIEKAVSYLTDLNAKAFDVGSIAELKHIEQQANELIHGGLEVEETIDLRQRIQRAHEERTREYRRIRTSLEQLTSNSKSAGKAELEAILARQRILVQKFPKETCFGEQQLQLEAAVAKRTKYLTEVAASEQQMLAENLDEVNFAESDTAAMRASRLKDQAQATQSRTGTSPSAIKFIIGSIALIAIIAVLGVFEIPRAVVLRTQPNAVVTIGSVTCRTPCNMKLKPGEHPLYAREKGFVDRNTTIDVPFFGSELPSISLAAAVPIITERNPIETDGTTDQHLLERAKIEVRTSVPTVLVYSDDSIKPIGESDAQGRFQFLTTPGKHQLRVEKPGYSNPDAQIVNARLEKPAPVSFILLPVAQARSSQSGLTNPQANNGGTVEKPGNPEAPHPAPILTFLGIQAPVNAEVHIDEQVKGHSTGGTLKVPVQPGSHTVEVFLQGFEPYKTAISVDLGKELDVPVQLKALKIENPQKTPSAPPPQNEANSKVSDQEKIAQRLQVYKEGFQAKDPEELRSVWPSLTDKKFREMTSILRDAQSIQVSLDCPSLEISGNEAVQSCQQDMTITEEGKPQKLNNAVTFQWKKLGVDGEWVIYTVEVRRK